MAKVYQLLFRVVRETCRFWIVFFYLTAAAVCEESSEKKSSFPKLFEPGTKLTWVMVNVNSREQQGDAHLLVEPGGAAVLIDCAEQNEARQVLLPLLKRLGISTLKAVLVTHPHLDHAGGLVPLLESEEISIEKIYMGPVSKAKCAAESYSCDWLLLEKVALLAKTRQVPILRYDKFDDIKFKGGVVFSKIVQFDEAGGPVTDPSMNDLSLVARLKVGKTSVLFPGDLNMDLSRWLVTTHASELKSDILKFPHHGGESFAHDSFFEAVGATTFLVPGPSKNWCGKRSERARQLVAGKSVYVNALDGHVFVYFDGQDFKIRTTNKKSCS